VTKPIKFPLKFFSGGDRSGQTCSENRRKIIFVWGCPLGAFLIVILRRFSPLCPEPASFE
jgi:hypothetical protein